MFIAPVVSIPYTPPKPTESKYSEEIPLIVSPLSYLSTKEPNLSLKLGENKKDEAAKSIGQAVSLTVLISVIISVFAEFNFAKFQNYRLIFAEARNYTLMQNLLYYETQDFY